MSAPETKERPASMLRAVFASVGSLLSGKDKRRTKPAAQTPADAGTAAPEAPSTATPEAVTPEAAAPEALVPDSAVPDSAVPDSTVPESTAAEPEAVAEPETVAVDVVVAEIFQPEVVVSETGEPEVVVAETVVVAAVGTELPLANYDEASVASLRARLRNLSVAQLEQLTEYEKNHANRADVIVMFERRIAKVRAEG
ncbi:MAG TPA: hypothetical protein VGD91_17860 [Trebonia sp.]